MIIRKTYHYKKRCKLKPDFHKFIYKYDVAPCHILVRDIMSDDDDDDGDSNLNSTIQNGDAINCSPSAQIVKHDEVGVFPPYTGHMITDHGKQKRRKKKDPKAPKRPLSA